MQNELQKLMQKDMDRKDFLKHVGIGFAAIAGVTAALKTITSLNNAGKTPTGYGSSTYGGSPSVGKVSPVTDRKVQS